MKVSSFKFQVSSCNWVSGFIAIGASLCFSFCDSAWFSAVEAEVYAMSAMLTSLSLWIMMVWWFESSVGRRKRLLILVAYLIGLSLGVHQLNLLCIPVYFLIWLYRKKRRVKTFLIVFWLLIGLGIVGLVLKLFMPGSLELASQFELLTVNTWGWPYHSGLISFVVLSFALIVFCIWLTQRNQGINVGLWMLFCLMVGYSSFGILLIRSNASPALNTGTPNNVFALASYINRDLYPSTPLLYGETPKSRPLYDEVYNAQHPGVKRYLLKKGNRKYIPYQPGVKLNPISGFMTAEDSLNNEKVINQKHGYLIEDYAFKQVMDPQMDMWFPRMTSHNSNHIEAYKDWSGFNGEKPTYLENLKYFASYQFFYMYLRYLLWNFVGRQNDYHSTGEINHGNFITGIRPIDEAMLGDQSTMPSEIGEDNPGHNVYYGIPFMLGIIGVIYLAVGGRFRRRILFVTFIFFIMTGLAIVVYLNQSPGEPRERDYTFLGSYMAFVMWIATGMFALISLAMKRLPKIPGLLIAFLISFFPATLMAVVNFDDHNRRGRFETEFYASSLLEFDQPSIIFSFGDNSTFPLWYASEIMDKGKESTVVDISYLALPSYVDNLKKQGKRGLPLSSSDSVERKLKDFFGWNSSMTFKQQMLLEIIASQLTSDNSKVLYFPYTLDKKFYEPLDSLLSPAPFGKIYAPHISQEEIKGIFVRNMVREISKLQSLKLQPHYVDPVTAGKTKRYRADLIVAANYLLDNGETELSEKIANQIEEKFPFQQYSAAVYDFIDRNVNDMDDYIRLNDRLFHLTGNSRYIEINNELEKLREHRKQEWTDYFYSLSPSHRALISR